MRALIRSKASEIQLRGHLPGARRTFSSGTPGAGGAACTAEGRAVELTSVNRGETIQTLAEILLHVDALSASLEKVSPLASKMSRGASRTTLIHLVLAVSAERERQMERARTLLCQGRAEVERECGAEEASKHFALMEARHEAARATYGEWRASLASLTLFAPVSAA